MAHTGMSRQPLAAGIANEEAMSDRDPLIDERAVEAMTGISVNTLRWYRHVGDRGPAYLKLGRRVRYRESDVMAWLDAARVETAVQA